ncbi:hypothetical protein NJO91_15310 [Streptomyces microflavus]|uniref:hypothetical protein n=1 Tax=Streptomyces microflavus TaxID=1919 RepID=UPI0029AB591E|nr:hypothetical protein [Streptomyces microflavus]MDX2404487.1 hypothetical protein [Streptomyces microflavus]
MTSTKPARSDPDVTLHEGDSRVGTGTAPRATAGFRHLTISNPPRRRSRDLLHHGTLARLRHQINHHETGQSGTVTEPFLENDDSVETELVEIKSSKQG